MILSDTLKGMEFDRDGLTWAELGEKEVRVGGMGKVVAKEFWLVARRVVFNVSGKDGMVFVEEVGVDFGFRNVRLAGADDVKTEDDGVVGVRLGDGAVRVWLF